MEVNLQQRRKALLAKIPDIEQTLGVVTFLAARRAKAEGKEEDVASDAGSDDIDALLDGDEDEDVKDKPLTTLFELNDTLYAEAVVQETGEVGLWLGVSLRLTVTDASQANTMLLYPLAEASELLTGKLASAKKNLAEVVEDLEWIREQVTVMEVNFARVHNWDVKRRRAQQGQSSLIAGNKGDEDK